MKKINLSVMAILLGSALAFAGSTSVSLPKTQSLQWFELAVGGDPSNPDDYTLADGAPSGCTVRQERCAIYAEEDMGNPGLPTEEGVKNPIQEVFRASTR
ncbi:MAG: hypothetical protein LPK07_15700 [Hymenobacteraceae bacterium]|nr:hypothetical protein [Hymenobacteraceae bacterium]MDX5483123.1 hypothetical protein [Hymenobacteraceae bacterium]